MGSAASSLDVLNSLASPGASSAPADNSTQSSLDVLQSVANQPDQPIRAEMPPSAKERYWKSLGLTSEGQSIGEAFQHDIGYMKDQPGAAAKELATSPVTGYANAAAEQYQRAADHFHKGDYVGGLIHGLYYLLTPVGGANMGRAAEQSEKGDYAGAAGSMTVPAVTVAAGSPSTRGAVNAGRTVAADVLEKNSGKIGRTVAVGTGAHFGGAAGAFLGDTLSSGAASLVKRLGSALRPGEAPISMMPLTRQVLGSPDMKAFLNSPGIEGEIVDRAHQGGLPQGPHQLLLGAGQYEMPESVSAVNRDAETAAEQEVIDKNLYSKLYFNHTSPEMRDFEFMRRIQHSMNAQEGTGPLDLSLSKTKKLMSQPLDNKPYVDAAANSLGKDAKFSDVQSLAKNLQAQDEDMAHLLMKSIERVKDQKLLDRFGKMPEQEQGGHAGGGVSSVEELSRSGKNYLVSKSGQVTYHGKSFAPEETPPGGAHVTVLPNGQIRINAGTLSPAQKLAVERAQK